MRWYRWKWQFSSCCGTWWEFSPFITKKNKFQRISQVIFAVQLFAVFPIKGVLNEDIEKLHFKPVSVQTIFCLSLIVFNLIEYGLLFYHVPVTGIQTFGYVIFYGVAIGAAIKFIHLAHNWRDLIRVIYKYERPFTRYPYKQANNMSLRKKIRVLGFAILILSGLEHGLLFMSNAYMITLKIEKCNLTSMDVGRFYIEETRHVWLSIWDYHPLQILVFEYGNYAITYCWNFVDIMVMIMSVMVSYRFDQIYERVRRTKGSGMVAFMYPQKFWKEIRSNYVDVLRMLHKINEQISFLIVLSLFNSIYFICLQLYNSFL